MNDQQTKSKQLVALFRQHYWPEGPIPLRDTSDFGQVGRAHGQQWIVTPEEAAIKKKRPASVVMPPAIQSLLNRAHQLKDCLEHTSFLTRSALARKLGLDPSRISQLLNLTILASSIQDYIRKLSPTRHHPQINDRQWMRLARIRTHSAQLKAFKELIAK